MIFTIPKSLRGKCTLSINDVEFDVPAEVASIEVLSVASGGGASGGGGSLRPEDGSIAALQHRADGNADSCREFVKALQRIIEVTSEPMVRQIAENAVRMSWLTEELPK